MHSTSELDSLCVVLVAPRNPLNIGAAARAMSNFGASTLRLVQPYDVAFRDARSAVGAEDVLATAEVFTTLAEAVADCSLVVGTTAAGSRRDPQHLLRPLREAALLIGSALRSATRTALLFGSEKRGLANEDLSHCHWLLHIPTRARQPSMNLGQAVAVCLYELARVSPAPVFSAETAAAGQSQAAELASSAELERLTGVLLECLAASGYTLPDQALITEENVRRLVRRLAVERQDAERMLGMLRQILWKLRNDGG
ncbi:MAG TPA: TrmJ/YjtD family RNA methyltransferase [Acidisarcina sp.]